ncbi:MAG TPA: sulfatase [Thermoanaerobaculia bacterium]|nr:sulfatase [Thermoanaerobaculia bacterium]
MLPRHFHRLFAPAFLALTAVFAACRLSTSSKVEPLPAKSNILLITVDTLRADHLSSYGYPRATTPAIDRLAAEGVRFDQPSSQWPKTTPSFASMFTATYSKDNGIVRKVGTPLPCRFRTVAEALKAQGYATYAVVANGAVGSDFYFDQGFDTFIETWKLPHGAIAASPANGGSASGDGDPNRAEAVTRLASGLLDRIDRKKPFFLWVHYIDPHWPYSPPGEWKNRFQGDRWFDPKVRIPIAKGKARQEMMGIGEGQAEGGHDELAFYVARYDAEIAYTDSEIGKLLAAVRGKGLLDHTLTAFTADHGESLGDHHYFFDHGRFGFQTCLRVPLIFHYPGVLAPRVDRDPVELIDLAPTLLEAAGLPLPGGRWMQGRTLTARLRGARQEPAAPAAPPAVIPTAHVSAPHPSLAFSEAGYELNNKWMKIVRDRRFKLIFAQDLPDQRWTGGDGVRFILFDLDKDPGETSNAADRFPADTERLKRALAAWERAPRFDVLVDPPSAACKDERQMDPETAKLLHSLGYL